MSAVDPGLGVVERVREALEPSAPWVIGGARGFTWWPSRFSQRLTAGEAEPLAGAPAWRVRAELPLLRGVEGDARAFALLARWNAMCPGFSALRWNGDDRTVSLHASVLAREGAEDAAARVLASAALLQLGDATRDAESLARELGGVPAHSAPPGGVPRAEPDALIEGWRRFAEAGAAETPFTAERFHHASHANPAPWLRVHVDAAGLHAESACALASDPQPGSAPGAGVALLHLLGGQAHPALGAGLIAALSLPPEAEPVPERMVSTAALLNEAEAREPVAFDSLGAWCVHASAGLAWVSFWPALLDGPGLLEELAWTMAARARWARGFLGRVHALRADSPAP